MLSNDLASFCRVEIPIEHSNAAIAVMARLGVIADPVITGGRFVPLRDYLRASQICARARFGEGNITPVVGFFWGAVVLYECSNLYQSWYCAVHCKVSDQSG